MLKCSRTTPSNRQLGSQVLTFAIVPQSTKGNPRDRTVVYVPAVSFATVYKSEVVHQYDICNYQCNGSKDDSDEFPAGMLHLTVMLMESFAPCGGITDFAEHRGQNTENQRRHSNSRPEKIAQRKCKRHYNHEEPAHEQQHTAVKVVMLPLAESLGHIPDIVDDAKPEAPFTVPHCI